MNPNRRYFLGLTGLAALGAGCATKSTRVSKANLEACVGQCTVGEDVDTRCLSGCAKAKAEKEEKALPSKESSTAQGPSNDYAMQVLGIQNPAWLARCGDNYQYVTRNTTLDQLKLIAGISCGQITVTKTNEGYVTDGSYDQEKDPNGKGWTLNMVCKIADKMDGTEDGVIIPKAATVFLHKTYEKYGNPQTSLLERIYSTLIN